ncbi:TetR/AcrR family transcriptional regulator [Nocardia sp. SSK8]|uniref:TetR/AcrR family transcriptional regulator n=1 Tax=Nocardia sp. SSK8 TaxID=3120154 RepID=UPI0030080EAA
MSPEPAVSSTPQRGRPRDPEFENRVFDAAITLYARGGLDTLSMGAVAREARVGKASLYIRWPDKIELLRDALDARIVLDTDVDTGDLRSDLRRLAGQMLDMLDTEVGVAYLRRIVDRAARPEISLRKEGGREDGEGGANLVVLAARRLVHNAVRRGELPTGADPTVMMDMLFGATMMHAAVTPVALRPRAKAKAKAYLDTLVDTVIAGISHTAPSGGSTETPPG